MLLADVISAVGCRILSRVFAKARAARTSLDFQNLQVNSTGRDSHPCTERKDGAPLLMVVFGKVKSWVTRLPVPRWQWCLFPWGACSRKLPIALCVAQTTVTRHLNFLDQDESSQNQFLKIPGSGFE